MRKTMLRRLLQVAFAVASTAIMLGATAGLSAAAPGVHGHEGRVGQNGNGHSEDNARPGWGFGDTNHDHFGPPGQGCSEDDPCPTPTTAGPISSEPSGQATHFALSVPSSASAGSSFSFTVTALDSSDNTASSYNGTVHFTSTDGAANLPPNSALTNGTATFSATLSTTGNQTITATDIGNSSITGASTSIAVSVSGAVTHFALSVPSSVSASSPFTFTVTALDQNNNTATSYSGAVQLTSSDAAAYVKLPTASNYVKLPTYATLTNGVGSFLATLATVGNQTITATDTLNSSITGTSGNIAVSASGSATHFLVSAPANATAGSPFTFTVTALDQNNNTATSYTGTVQFASSDKSTSVQLPAESTLTNGVGSFSATLATAGTQTITATDKSSSSVTGTSGNIAVSASGSVARFVVSAPQSVAAGSPFSVSVTAVDANGNTVTSYNGTVHFTTTSRVATLVDGTLTNGTGTFSATLGTTGPQTITATDTLNSSLKGTSGSITVE